MRKTLSNLLFLLVILPTTAHASGHFSGPATNGPSHSEMARVSYRQVVERVSSENLAVYDNALKVYQAKKAISVARGNLLPKLNIWRILSIPFDFKSALGLVEDIAPFLIPGNWFQLKAQKDFYLAEVEGYKVLWANEVMTAKSLYLHLLFDRGLLERIELAKRELEEIRVIVKSREVLGGLAEGPSREIEVRLLALDEDLRSLKVLIEDESSLLGQMLGYNSMTKIELEQVVLPDYEKNPLLKYADYEPRVLSVSSELRQYDYLIHASKYVKDEASFSIFGVGTLSRGVAGGIFDNVPMQDGLGFGTPASIKIAKSQTERIKVQKVGAAETLKRQLYLVISNYNLDLQNYTGIKKRVTLTNSINDQLYERLRLGQDVEMLALIEASRNHIQAETAHFNAQFRYLMNQDKIMRLAMDGDYAKPPTPKEELEKKPRRLTRLSTR